MVFSAALFSVSAQAYKPTHMAQVFVKGYYVNAKGDTVKGQIQVNPDDQTDFYKQFAFLPPKSKKSKTFTADARIKAYGLENRNFVLIEYGGERFFVERLTMGRIRFYERQFHGKVDGKPGIESAYFIKDTGAEGDDKSLAEIQKISIKFYKRNLKPYLKDQPMIWTDLDKYNFDETTVVSAIREFNSFYASRKN